MKLVLFVEGHTERGALPGFFKRWLDPQLTQPIGIKTVRFEGWRDYYDEIGKKVHLNLSGKAGADVVGAVGLLDLYGPTFYPKDVTVAAERYAWAKTHLETKVNHPRFLQHFAVHETEAWLLSNPPLLPKEVRAALPGRCAHPETVNFDEPPAKLLERLHRDKLGRTYKKVTDGANLFARLDPDVARNKCPWLKQLLDDMLSLVRAAEP
jgi:hypothetical protein